MEGGEFRNEHATRLLEDFLEETYEERMAWLAARQALTPEVRALTSRLIESMEAGDACDPAVIESVPLMIAEALEGEFLDVFGEAGPPQLQVMGDGRATVEGRKRLIALLRMGLEADSRAEGLEVLGRLEAARGQVPGLGHSFAGWLYTLAPGVFPPLPNHVVRGLADVLGGQGGIVDSARKIWELADAHAGLFDGADLGLPAAFLGWIGRSGPDALARGGTEFYGFNRLVHDTLLDAEFVDQLEQELASNGMLLLTGPTGTGKTHTALRIVKYLTRERGEATVLRAHPGLGYAELAGQVQRPGLIVRVADRARRDPEGCYPILIDEINRLDVSAAFGELAMAFEFPGQTVTLATGETFRVPPNLFLVATSDQGQSDLLVRDYLFYRRFSHAAFAPDPDKLQEWLKRNNDPVKRVDLVHAFRNLNRTIRDRTGNRFAIGHGFLMVDGLSDDNVNEFWDNYVLPFVRAHVADQTMDMEIFRLSRLL